MTILEIIKTNLEIVFHHLLKPKFRLVLNKIKTLNFKQRWH
jgi:hypothetical protein